MAPIGVHAALILIMAGGAASALLGFHGTVLLPSGLSFAVPAALEANSVLARPSSSSNLLVTLERFDIDYRPSGEVCSRLCSGCCDGINSVMAFTFSVPCMCQIGRHISVPVDVLSKMQQPPLSSQVTRLRRGSSKWACTNPGLVRCRFMRRLKKYCLYDVGGSLGAFTLNRLAFGIFYPQSARSDKSHIILQICPSLQVKQFFSELRVQDFYGRELLRKTISVNDPLRCQVWDIMGCEVGYLERSHV